MVVVINVVMVVMVMVIVLVLVLSLLSLVVVVAVDNQCRAPPAGAKISLSRRVKVQEKREITDFERPESPGGLPALPHAGGIELSKPCAPDASSWSVIES